MLTCWAPHVSLRPTQPTSVVASSTWAKAVIRAEMAARSTGWISGPRSRSCGDRMPEASNLVSTPRSLPRSRCMSFGLLQSVFVWLFVSELSKVWLTSRCASNVSSWRSSIFIS